MKERIRQLRKYFELSQAEFAKRINKTPGFISLLETGRSGVSAGTVKLITEAFGVNPEWLKTGEGEMLLQTIPAGDRENVGKRINKVRTDLGMSISQFAELVPCSKSHIINIENGNVVPSEEFLKRVANTFFVSYDWLLTGKKKTKEEVSAEDAEKIKKISEYLKTDSVAREVVWEAMEKDRSIWLMLDRVIRTQE